MAASAGKKFFLLFKKNWIIQSRKKCCTIVEIVIPVVLVLFLLLARALTTADDIEEPTRWAEFNVNTLPSGLGGVFQAEPWIVAFTPNNSVTRDIMLKVGQLLNVETQGKYSSSVLNGSR